jgi:hypothetical protein
MRELVPSRRCENVRPEVRIPKRRSSTRLTTDSMKQAIMEPGDSFVDSSFVFDQAPDLPPVPGVQV